MCKDQNRNDPFKRTAFKSTTSVSPAYMFCLVFKCLPADVGLVAWHALASDQGAGGPGCGWEEEGEERRWDEQPSYQREGNHWWRVVTMHWTIILSPHLVPSPNQSHVWSLKVVDQRRSHNRISREDKEHWLEEEVHTHYKPFPLQGTSHSLRNYSHYSIAHHMCVKDNTKPHKISKNAKLPLIR